MNAAWLRSLLYRQPPRQDEDTQRFRVYVNPVGLAPWMWKGMRGFIFVFVLAALFVFGAVLHWYYAAAIISIAILVGGALLSRKYPFWPEMLARLIFQPIGFLDT